MAGNGKAGNNFENEITFRVNNSRESHELFCTCAIQRTSQSWVSDDYA